MKHLIGLQRKLFLKKITMNFESMQIINRKNFYIIVQRMTSLIIIWMISFSGRVSVTKENRFSQKGFIPGSYKFDKTISRKVLENYLSRAITMQDLLIGQGDFDDNLRMLKSIGAKYIGRSVCQWGGEANLLKNLAKEKELALKVHATDPDIILEACIFEIVSRQIEEVPVPGWAFTALGMPVEKRNFRYDSIIYADGRMNNQWHNGSSVPDVSRPETKLMFYFLAASYINLGIEAIHFGQVELMNKNDLNLDH